MTYPSNTTRVIYSTPNGKRPLSPSFQPGPYDVICARGKLAHSHEGNQRFRELVKLHRHRYAAASTKYEKSQIVSHITNIVRSSSPEGGFVKQFKARGSYGWYEVGDRAAKEKIVQTMRDLLHTKYSSSTKAKARVRIQKRVQEYTDSEDSFSSAAAPEDVKSGVSVVSNDSTVEANNSSKPDSVPSLIRVAKEMPPLRRQTTTSSSKTQSLGMFIPTPVNEPSGAALLDALFEKESQSNDDPFPVEPISMAFLPIVEFDSDFSMGQDDLLDFCDAMGIAC